MMQPGEPEKQPPMKQAANSGTTESESGPKEEQATKKPNYLMKLWERYRVYRETKSEQREQWLNKCAPIWTQDDLLVLRDRMRNFGGDSLRMIYSFMKVIALTTATIALMRLVLQAEWALDFSLTLNWPLVFLFLAWGISFIVLLITYEAPMFASVLLLNNPPWWITFFPSVFTVFEFLVFAILSPTFFTVELEGKPKFDDHQILVRWFVINGGYHLFIGIFCLCAVFYFKGFRQWLKGQALADVVDEYRKYLWGEFGASFAMGIISLLFGLCFWHTAHHPLPTSMRTVLACALVGMFAFVYYALTQQYKKRRKTVAMLETKWLEARQVPLEGRTGVQPPA